MIRFKAYHPASKTLFQSDEIAIHFLPNIPAVVHTKDKTFTTDPNKTDHIILLLCSDVYDKLKKEISVGDIIKYTSEDGTFVHNEVIYYKGAICWKGEITGQAFPFIDDDINEHAEIVGNIYLNPELLIITDED